MSWIAGYNQPGYLPKGGPEEFESWEDAIEWLLCSITRRTRPRLLDSEASEYGEQLLDDETREPFDDIKEDLITATTAAVDAEPEEDFTVMFRGYAYWVVEE